MCHIRVTASREINAAQFTETNSPRMQLTVQEGGGEGERERERGGGQRKGEKDNRLRALGDQHTCAHVSSTHSSTLTSEGGENSSPKEELFPTSFVTNEATCENHKIIICRKDPRYNSQCGKNYSIEMCSSFEAGP